MPDIPYRLWTVTIQRFRPIGQRRQVNALRGFTKMILLIKIDVLSTLGAHAFDVIRLLLFDTFAEGYTVTAEWIRFYNERRMHGSLHDWSPAQYYAGCRAGTAPPIKAAHC